MKTMIIVFIISFIIILIWFYTINKQRIVVSLTTSPQRINSIKPVIDSMLNQSVRPDLIYLNLPKIFLRNNTTFDSQLPSFITDNPLICVNFCDDIGPATKIIPTIYNETNPETYILSIDDDIYYPQDLIKNYIKYSKYFKDSIITGYSLIENKNIQDNLWFKNTNVNTNLFNCKLVDLFEGFSGVLYKRKFFNKELMNDFYKHLDRPGCKYGDDFYLSNLFKKYNIRIICLDIKINWDNSYNSNSNKLIPLKYGLNQDALHLGSAGGNKNNYIKATQYLKSVGELYIEIN